MTCSGGLPMKSYIAEEKHRVRWAGLFVVAALATVGCLEGTARAGDKKVNVLRTPNHGIQPQAVVDGKGVLHLIYFKGDAGKGDLFYVRRQPGTGSYSEPLQVNSERGSAIATG